jgi:hypothetical protein
MVEKCAQVRRSMACFDAVWRSGILACKSGCPGPATCQPGRKIPPFSMFWAEAYLGVNTTLFWCEFGICVMNVIVVKYRCRCTGSAPKPYKLPLVSGLYPEARGVLFEDKMTPKTPIELRFWNKLEHVGDCWEWTGFRSPQGYGSVAVNGKAARTHRVAYMLTFGEIPAGMCVCHKCDNPPCCNPAHLFLGTHKDNRIDCIRKGREGHEGGAPKGCEARPAAKLKPEQIIEIRELRKSGKQYSELAEMFGVCKSQIGHIVCRKQWQSIT